MAAVCSITKSVAEFPEVGKVGVVAFETHTVSAVLRLSRSLAPLSTNNLPLLSRESITYPTIRMESFEDSPDAERHGGYSILR
jgi:hypothetical protein